ncbi:fluoride efflux transporter CrcB [Rhodococcus sp. NPDC056960]|jgi:CrcB protein|uniref:fluoride efflux transporter CrcB n=1 Tax=Rhodococcus sp. NPDC056960 TaxID=3345982 RepID=UPI00362C0F5A
MTVVWIACAGSAGAVARFVVDGAIRHRRASEFPWATGIINVSGSLLLGFLVGMVLFHTAPHEWQVIAGVGFCGGYTTFSTASFETVRLIQRQRYWAGVANAVGTAASTLAAAAAGLGLASL